MDNFVNHIKEIKKEFKVEHLYFFYCHTKPYTVVCSLELNPEFNGILAPMYKARVLKYALEPLTYQTNSLAAIYFIESDRYYTDLDQLRQDSLVLSIAGF